MYFQKIKPILFISILIYCIITQPSHASQEYRVDSNKELQFSMNLFGLTEDCDCDIEFQSSDTEKPMNGNLIQRISGITSTLRQFPTSINIKFIDTIYFVPDKTSWGTGTIRWSTSTDPETIHELTIHITPTTIEDNTLSFLDDFMKEYNKTYAENDNSESQLSSITITQFPKKGQLKKSDFEINQQYPTIDTEYLDQIVYDPDDHKNGKDVIKWTANELNEAITITINIDPDYDAVLFDLRNELPINKANEKLPKILKENEALSFFPAIIENDMDEFSIHIEKTNATVIATVKDNNLNIVNTHQLFPVEIAADNTPKLLEIKKNSRYNITSDPGITLQKKISDDTWEPTPLDDSIPIILDIDHTIPADDKTFKFSCNSCTSNSTSIKIINHEIFTFGINKNPNWLHLNESTGEVYGTPRQNDVGTHENIVLKITSDATAQRKYGQSQPFKITVENINDQPITYDVPGLDAPPLMIQENETTHVDLKVSDIDPNDTHTFFISKTSPPNYGNAYINPFNKAQLIYEHLGSEKSTIDVFKYYAIDSSDAKSIESTITINITPINDRPTVQAIAVIMDRNQKKTIELNGKDAEDDRSDTATLRYKISQPDGTSDTIESNTYDYQPSETIINDEQLTKTQLTFMAIDSTGAESNSAPIDVFFYFKNQSPDHQLLIPDIEFNIGNHMEETTTVWDINNEITLNDTANKAQIKYKIDPPNDYFDIHETSGKIQIKTPLNTESTPDIHMLSIYATATFLDKTIIGVNPTVTINIQQSLLNADHIKDIENQLKTELNLYYKDDITWDMDTQKSFNIDTGSNLKFNNANVTMNHVTIGGREESKVIFGDSSRLTAENMTLGKEKDHLALITMDKKDSSLLVENKLILGENGHATLKLYQGKAMIKGDLDIGNGEKSTGELDLKNGELIIEKNVILGTAGHAKINHSGGRMIIKNNLAIGGPNATATFNMSNGQLDTTSITIDESATFKFTGGSIRTKKITGTFKNSGGTLLIGNDTKSNTISTFTRSLSLPLSSPLNEQHTIINGHYIQDYGEDAFVSNLYFSINGTDESQNGKLIVSETANVDGKLTVEKTGAFEFEINQAFNIIEAKEIHGHFSKVSLPTLSPDLQWNIQELYSRGTIKVAQAKRIAHVPKTAFIYPNPIIDSGTPIRIFYTLDQSQPITIEIYNMFGHQLHKEHLQEGSNGTTIGDHLIPLPTQTITNWPSGIYLLLIHNGNEPIARGKFSVVAPRKN